MFNISSYLSKFTKSITDLESQKIEVIKVIKNYTQIEIQLDKIEIKNGVVYIDSNPAVKNKLYIYKEKILGEVNRFMKVGDIR